jgi:hypothetical protein
MSSTFLLTFLPAGDYPTTVDPQLDYSPLRVEVTFRLTVSQLASLGVQPHLGLMTRYVLLFENYGIVY